MVDLPSRTPLFRKTRRSSNYRRSAFEEAGGERPALLPQRQRKRVTTLSGNRGRPAAVRHPDRRVELGLVDAGEAGESAVGDQDFVPDVARVAVDEAIGD